MQVLLLGLVYAYAPVRKDAQPKIGHGPWFGNQVYRLEGSRDLHLTAKLLGPKTLGELRQSIDWDLWESKPYVVIDPADPNELLYLTTAAYQRLLGQCISNAIELVKVASPSSTRPIPGDSSPGSKTSPLPKGAGKLGKSIKAKLAAFVFGNTHFRHFSTWTVSQARVSPTDRNIPGLILKWGQILTYWQGETATHRGYADWQAFGEYLGTIYRKHGAAHLVLRMKVMALVTYKFIAGDKVTDTRSLGVRIALSNGLPKALPLSARAAIRAGSLRFIRTWGSILYMYKGFKAPYPDPDLSSIAAEPGLATPGFIAFVPLFWRWIRRILTNKWESPDLAAPESGPEWVPKTFASVASGPNAKASLFGIFYDLAAWYLNMGLSDEHPLPLQWFIAVGNETMVKLWMDGYRELHRRKLFPHPLGLSLGKLALRYEAAGKVRVFAIGDYWTQACLRPLHDWLFHLLDGIPSDATFNQEGRVRELAARGHKQYYCFDLKSATDMIPMPLYTELFKGILPENVVHLWSRLLIDRKFVVPWLVKETSTSFGNRRPKMRIPTISYTRGQPMGFLSSWASLALVHHALVQYSAFRASHETWFNEYLVLGDDIVIADSQVAIEYQKVCEELGIPLSVAKGLISPNGTLNFASLFVKDGVDISPISFKEELSVNTPAARRELVARILRRGWLSPVVSNALKLLISPHLWQKGLKSLIRGRMTPEIEVALRYLLSPGSTLSKTLVENSSPVLAWSQVISCRMRKPKVGLLGDLGNPTYLSSLKLDPITRQIITKLSRMILDEMNRIIMDGMNSYIGLYPLLGKDSERDDFLSWEGQCWRFAVIPSFSRWNLQQMPNLVCSMYRISRYLDPSWDAPILHEEFLDPWLKEIKGAPSVPYVDPAVLFEELVDLYHRMPQFPKFNETNGLEAILELKDQMTDSTRAGQGKPPMMEMMITKIR